MEKLRYFVFIPLILFSISWVNRYNFYQDQTKDLAFAKDAASSGIFEVTAGKLAAEKATDNNIKAFAEHMVADHSKANEELKSLAAKKAITLPDSMDAQKQMIYNKISRLTGKAFEKEYVAEMVKAHDIDVNKFQAATKTLVDSDLKAWASKTLPTLQMHQKHAHSMAGAGNKTK